MHPATARFRHEKPLEPSGSGGSSNLTPKITPQIQPTCPNRQWTPNIVDVTFTTATLTLLEGGAISDTVTVPVS